MSMRASAVLFATLFAAIFTPWTLPVSVADTIEFVDGTTLDGKVLDWWNGTVRVELADGSIREIPYSEIRTLVRIVQSPPPARTSSVREDAGALEFGRADGLGGRAAPFARQAGFAGQAGAPFQAGVLDADPDPGVGARIGAAGGGRKRFQAGIQGAVVDAGIGANSGNYSGSGRRKFQVGIVGASADRGPTYSDSSSGRRRSFRAGIQ
jgi:hypothetical protein